MAWAGGMLFAAAAKAANLGDNATAAQVYTGLYALQGDTLGGLAPPLTFHQGQPTSVNCWFYSVINNHQFTSPYGTAPTCAST
jgi:branched-chain amino acid transport system substrate-binding protein